MEKVEFINSFSFIFSERPGTPAFNLPKTDPKEAKKTNRISKYLENKKLI